MLVNSVNVYSISVRFHTLREEISIIATRILIHDSTTLKAKLQTSISVGVFEERKYYSLKLFIILYEVITLKSKSLKYVINVVRNELECILSGASIMS
jgi:hypothetical protein